VTRRVGDGIARTIRAAKILVRDGRIPRPLRWAGAFGLLPIPGPVDELVLLLVGGILWLFYRERFTAAWQQAAQPTRAY
jgi:hypothetical protein